MVEMDAAPHERAPGRALWRGTPLGRLCIALLVCGALALTLFPFDWLATIWPAYAVLFDRVFASAASHHIGHSVLFCVVGLAILVVVPALRTRPWQYAVLVVCGALGQEAIQALAKRQWPHWGDARDIGFDLLGLALAFVATWVVARLRSRAV